MWETNIQLRNRRFFGLGNDNRIEFNRAVEEVRRVLRDVATKEEGLLRSEIEDRIDEDVGKGTLDRALTWLEEELGEIRRERGEGRGRPFVYWRPNPLDSFSPNPLTGGRVVGRKNPKRRIPHTQAQTVVLLSPQKVVLEKLGKKKQRGMEGTRPG